ncbi:DDE-type integrase/transposase/recombinase [Streptomyces sp. NRRL S-241]|uniref:DDE-type integrase/transposase/recombinase n=1 Tax=Streptomyces sp. NRRL S-241 TaxID=1463896 RepID=UPI00068A070A|nr:DDE-type integrase/transposase/recombinase [Streptomyces sp. NRRL S-241]
MGTSLAADALTSAGHQRGPDSQIVFQSDRGSSTPASHALHPVAAGLGVRRFIGRTGVCRDNAVAESFFASLKNELVTQCRWHTHTAARAVIFE